LLFWGGAAAARTCSLRLELEDCMEYFTAVTAMHAEHKDHFDKSLDIIYEDLVSDYQGELRRVQEFLELPVRALESPFKKQARRPL